MPHRRRRKEEEELQRKKKALRKSYQKTFSGKKRVGSNKLSDTKKFILTGSVGVIIIIIVATQFLKPPTPYCYYIESDFIYAILDQNTEDITFKRIVAWYDLIPKHTTLTCDLTDYFDPVFGFDILVKPDSIGAIIDYDEGTILCQFIEEQSALFFTATMENGTSLQMSTWVNLAEMDITPSFIPKGITTIVNFKLDIITNATIDRCNISLEFNKNLESTSIEFSSIINGSVNEEELIFYTLQENLPVNSHVILDFNLSINTNLTSELNLLDNGEINLVMNDKLLSSFPIYSNFKESEIEFSEFMYDGDFPEVKKEKLLSVIIEVPYYKIDISS